MMNVFSVILVGIVIVYVLELVLYVASGQGVVGVIVHVAHKLLIL